jgi:peptidoglycan/xylan/chitin deacetylase (PgdA/CDA1 family)
MTLLAVNYHYISEEDFPHPGIYPLRPDDFARQLDELGRHFTFVSLTDIDRAAGGQHTLPKMSCVVTFDDGLRQQVEYALPILDRKGIPAAFFVNTAPVVAGSVSSVHQIHHLRATRPGHVFMAQLRDICQDLGVDLDWQSLNVPEQKLRSQYRYDTLETAKLKFLLNFVLDRKTRGLAMRRYFAWQFGDERSFCRSFYLGADAIKQLSRRGYLGTHGHEHVPLATLSASEQNRNIWLSVQHLRRITGKAPWAISYPYGSVSAVARATAEAAARAGLRIGFTMERALNQSLDHPLLLARCDTNDAPGGKAPAIRLAGERIYARPPFGLRRSSA